MRRLWCFFFGHRLLRPKIADPGVKKSGRKGKGKGKDGYYTHCKRCRQLMVRNYFDGWQPASPRERAYYLRYYAPNATVQAQEAAE